MQWDVPIRKMPFEQRGFLSAVPTTDNVLKRAYNQKYWRELDKLDQMLADTTRICECGARNVYDQHTDTCWARPLRELPCERKGFKVSKPLPWKRVIINGRWESVLPRTNSLFSGKDSEGVSYKLRRLEAELAA